MNEQLRKSTFSQFLRIYLLFFLCMTLMIAAVCVQLFFQMRASVRDGLGESLTAGVARLDDEINAMVNAAIQFYNRSDFRSFEALRMPFKTIATVPAVNLLDEAKRIANMVNLSSHIGFVMKNGVVLTGTQLHLSLEDFYGTYYAVEGMDTPQAWLDSLRCEEGMFVFTQVAASTAGRRVEGLQFAKALSHTQANGQTLFYAFIDRNQLLSTLAMDGMLGDISIVVEDSLGQTLLAHNPQRTRPDSVLEATSRYGLRFHAAVRGQYINEQLVGAYRVFAIFAACYLAVGIVLSLHYTKKSAKPIVDILSVVSGMEKELLGGEAHAGTPSGYAYLRRVIGQISAQYKENQHLLDRQKHVLEETVMEQMLRSPDHLHALPMASHRYYPALPPTWRMVAMMIPDVAELTSEDYSTLQEMVRAVFQPLLPQGGWIHFSDDILVMLVPGGDEASLAVCKRLTEQGDRPPLASLRMNLRFAISRACTQAAALHPAFERMCHALRILSDDHGAPAAVYLEDDAPSAGARTSTRHMAFFALMQGDHPQEALAVLAGDIARLKQRAPPDVTELQQLFFNYRNALLMLWEGLPSDGAVTLPAFDPKMSADQYEKALGQAAMALHARLRSAACQTKNAMKTEIVEYIDRHFHDPDLYIRTITERFDISEAALQRTMRFLTGKTFQVYLEGKRLDKAQAMLRESELSIHQIVSRCGYTTVSAFYKAFKRQYGQSPGAYRDGMGV